MKKILLSVLTACLLLTARAQENDGIVYSNTLFGSFAVGASAYSHNGESSFGVPSVNLTGGVWLASPLAFQVSLDGIMGSDAAGNSSTFLFANAEFKWDVNSTFFHVYNRNYLSPVPFYPILGLGAAWLMDMDNSSIDNAFQMMLGLQAPYRIGNYMDAILQYKCYFLPQGFDNSPGDNYLHTFGVGLLFRQSTEPFHRRTERYTRGLAEDWFIGVGVGPNYSAFDLFTNDHLGGLDMVGVSPELMFGRNFSNFWSVRAEVGGFSAHEQYDTINLCAGPGYRYAFLHADLMLNVSNLIFRGRGVRFNLLPYLGAGPVWRFDRPSFDVATNFGLLFRYYLGRRGDLFLDAKYVMVTPSIGGGMGPSGKFYGVGLPSITMGYIHNFGQNSTRYRIPIYEVR